ncbi:MAG: dihydroneopterin aldolase [Bacillota bacterium]
MKKIDCLTAKNIQLWGRHGAAEAEIKHGQKFIVDVQVFYDMSRMAKTDSMGQGVSYGDIYPIVEEYVAKKSYNLIQTLAWRLANALENSNPMIQYACVTVKKLFVSFPGILAHASVTVTSKGAPERQNILRIEGMRFWSRFGLVEERQIGAEYVVDVEAQYDMGRMFETDELSDGLSVTNVYKATKCAMDAQYHLIQAAAQSIADAVRTEYERLEEVTVTVKKPNVMIESILDHLSVTITR